MYCTVRTYSQGTRQACEVLHPSMVSASTVSSLYGSISTAIGHAVCSISSTHLSRFSLISTHQYKSHRVSNQTKWDAKVHYSLLPYFSKLLYLLHSHTNTTATTLTRPSMPGYCMQHCTEVLEVLYGGCSASKVAVGWKNRFTAPLQMCVYRTVSQYLTYHLSFFLSSLCTLLYSLYSLLYILCNVYALYCIYCMVLFVLFLLFLSYSLSLHKLPSRDLKYVTSQTFLEIPRDTRRIL